jgi:hypothetical protein
MLRLLYSWVKSLHYLLDRRLIELQNRWRGEKSCFYRDLNSNSLTMQPVASRYTDCPVSVGFYYTCRCAAEVYHTAQCHIPKDREEPPYALL